MSLSSRYISHSYYCLCACSYNIQLCRYNFIGYRSNHIEHFLV